MSRFYSTPYVCKCYDTKISFKKYFILVLKQLCLAHTFLFFYILFFSFNSSNLRCLVLDICSKHIHYLPCVTIKYNIKKKLVLRKAKILEFDFQVSQIEQLKFTKLLSSSIHVPKFVQSTIKNLFNDKFTHSV